MQSLDLLQQQPIWRPEFTFGHVTADGAPVSQELIDKATNYLKAVVGEACGGGRVTHEPGFYQSSDGSLIDEASTCVWGYGRGEHIPFARFRHAAALVAAWLHQETVALAIFPLSGSFAFIEPSGEDAAAAD